MEAATPKTASSSMDFDPLIKKINNDDPDIRFMVLGDLQSMLNNSTMAILRADIKRSTQLVDALVERLDDSNGDVQSQALKTVAPLSGKLAESLLKSFLDKLVSTETKNSMDDAIFITAVQEVVKNLPRPSAAGPSRLVSEALDVLTVSVLPKLSQGLLETNNKVKPESIDLAREVVVCYGTILPEREKRQLVSKLLGLLDDDRASLIVQKRAVVALAALSVHLPDSLLRSELIPNIIRRMDVASRTSRKMRMFLTLVGSIAQASRGSIDPSIQQLVPYIFDAAGEARFDTLTEAAQEGGADVQGEEVVEAALTALDELLSSCTEPMKEYTDDVIASSARFLSYDPNVIQADDDMEAMDEDNDFEAEDEDDDFEEEAAMSDSDDVSWKVRRCAAKVLHTVIRTRAGTDLLQNGVLYERVAPILVKSLSEREESVRLESIAAIARLVQLTGELVGPSEYLLGSAEKTSSRKRRRSSAAAFPAKHQNLARGATSPRETPSPTSGPLSDLAKLAPKVAQAAINVIKKKQIASQQAAILLLKDLINARNGRLESFLQQLVTSAADIASARNVAQAGISSVPAGNSAAATGATLRIVALRLLAAICDSHSSKTLADQISDITEAAISAIDDAHFKISTEAIIMSESLIKALTPPRTLGATNKAQETIPKLFEVIIAQTQGQSAEREVRRTAVHALGFLLARTAGHPQLLGAAQRKQGTTILEERLKNEVTRLSTIEALDCIASAPMAKNDYPVEWLRSAMLELANQLRKADRTLSTTSLHTLHTLLSHDLVVEAVDQETGKSLVQLLLPVMSSQITNQLPLASGCIARIIKSDSSTAVEVGLIDTVTNLATTPISGNILEAYLDLVEVLGGSGAVANTLLDRLIKDVGVNGSPEVNGAAIGTLMAAGGGELSVGHSDIIKELQTTADPKRKALALAILGQYGYCMGLSSPLDESVFLDNLKDKADVARGAAVALGRAGAGNPSKYLPLILRLIQNADEKAATLLPALREVLSHRTAAAPEVAAHVDHLWQVLIRFSDSDDGKVVAAECVGKLVSMAPDKFVPLLQEQLAVKSAEGRGMVNQALRYALSDSDRHLDDALRPFIGDMLSSLLKDESIENRRLALMTFSAAISNKPSLVSPHIPQLSQIVIQRAEVDPSLVREVAMGPFKHKVDEGLEMRKSAYDTLHTLINASYPRLNSEGTFGRVIQGLSDDGDIKALCTLLVGKLLVIDREQSARYLHQYAAMFAATLSTKLKETAVKQEIERQQEANKDVLRATAKVNTVFPPGASGDVDAIVWQNWQAYMALVRKEHAAGMTQAETEVSSER